MLSRLFVALLALGLGAALLVSPSSAQQPAAGQQGPLWMNYRESANMPFTYWPEAPPAVNALEEGETYPTVYVPEDQEYFVSTEGQPTMQRGVLVQLRVPPNAKVWFNDQQTMQNGGMRAYVSPPLQPGRDYTYRIRAQWTEGGKPMDQTRDVTVHAGDRIRLDFMQPTQARR